MSAQRTSLSERIRTRPPVEADTIGPAPHVSLAERYKEMAHEGHEHRGVDNALRALDLGIAGVSLVVLSPLLLAIAAICAAVAAAKLKQPSPHFPSLTSRLRVAIKANPLQPDQLEAARDAAASVLLAPSAPPAGARGRRRRTRRDNRNMQTGLIVMAALLGWAAMRRRSHAQQPDV